MADDWNQRAQVGKYAIYFTAQLGLRCRWLILQRVRCIRRMTHFKVAPGTEIFVLGNLVEDFTWTFKSSKTVLLELSRPPQMIRDSGSRGHGCESGYRYGSEGVGWGVKRPRSSGARNFSPLRLDRLRLRYFPEALEYIAMSLSLGTRKKWKRCNSVSTWAER